MPGFIRGLLGFIILVATIGLATCQSMVKAEPSSPNASYAAGPRLTHPPQAE